jgi:voltage-gated potassium channel
METMLLLRRLKFVFALLLIIVFSGVIGYRIMGLDFVDSLYMVVITLTTTGFTEIGGDMTTGWRLFTMGILLSGMGALLYGISTATAFIVEGELGRLLRRRRIERRIAHLDKHFILCGLGHIGRYAFWEIFNTKRPLVLIDRSEEVIVELERQAGVSLLYVVGDASADLVLEQAGIHKAGGLISSFEDDLANIYVTLSARNLNPDLSIVSRAWDEGAAEKLTLAGADSIIQTDAIGGQRMVSEILNPAATTFLDIMLAQKDDVLRIENVTVEAESPLAGKPLAEARVGDRFDATLMAVRDGESGDFQYNPPADLTLSAGDVLVVLGSASHVLSLREAATHGRGVLDVLEKPPLLRSITKAVTKD